MAKAKTIKKETKTTKRAKKVISKAKVVKIEPIQVEEQYTPTYYTNRFNGKLYTAGLKVWNKANKPEVELTPVPPATGNKVWIKTDKSSNFYLSDEFGKEIK